MNTWKTANAVVRHLATELCVRDDVGGWDW